MRDRSFLRPIIEAADLHESDSVLEIGGGTGVLTEALAVSAARVLSVEVDDALYQLLGERFDDNRRVELWHGSGLAFNPCAHFSGPYKLIANIPYYITGPLVRYYLEAACRPTRLVLMVQREVADRMVALPGELSLLGVSVQFYARARIVTRVPAGAFYPRPKVDSAIVRLDPYPHVQGTDGDAFFTVARAGFSQKRKQVANSLASGLGVARALAVELLVAANIDPVMRAQDVSVDDWTRLAAVWRASRSVEKG